MAITWFDAKDREGMASLYSTNITLNTIASVPFQYAYKVQVGIDEEKNIVIEPLPKERVIRGDLDEYSLLDLQVSKSYTRICSSALMKHLSDVLGLALGKDPKKFETTWDEKANLLTIHTVKGGK
jgi:hypothetical protein